jgi:hypothetical protein
VRARILLVMVLPLRVRRAMRVVLLLRVMPVVLRLVWATRERRVRVMGRPLRVMPVVLRRV